MRVLLVHQNFPGQFRHLAGALVEAGHEVVAIGCRDDQPPLAGLRYCRIAADADGELRRPGIEARCLAQLGQGRRVAEQLHGLAAGGWRPDVVAGPPFWGDLLFLDDVYAEVPLLALMEKMEVRGMVHITGGGLVENIPRVLQPNLTAVLHKDAWTMPPLFQWLQQHGGVADAEMHRVFNCGIGMTVIVSADQADAAQAELKRLGETVYRIGTIRERRGDEAQTIVE